MARVCVFDLIGSPDSVIALHMGGAYEDRPATAARFVETMLPETAVLRYLDLENSERVWAVAEIVETALPLSIPAITDAFHHNLNPAGLALEQVLDLSLPTWEGRGVRPKLHLSSQDPAKQGGAHAYLVDDRAADAMVEATGKERALAPLGVEIG